MNTLSIIIVNYRSWGRLTQCLDALNGFSGDMFAMEVIIVDNFSNDGLLDVFVEKYPKFKFILNDGNNGFSDGCNKGATSAAGDYFLFLNPDTVATEESLLNLLLFGVQNPKDIVSCEQVNDKGRAERPYGRFPSLMRITGFLRFIRRILFGNDYAKEECNDLPYFAVDWVSGSVVLISKKQFSALGGWDNGFWMYYEDVDLCRRLKNAGGNVLFHRFITIEHNHGGASRINPAIASLTKCEVNISRHYYLSRHKKGFKGFLMHLFLIIDNLVFGLISFFTGLCLFFFYPGLKVQTMVYLKLVRYYFNAILRQSWISPRSVKTGRLTA